MSESELGISLVRDDLLFRIQRRIGLIPSQGLGVVRRTIFFALLAWLPIVVGRAIRALPKESVCTRSGQRCGIAIYPRRPYFGNRNVTTNRRPQFGPPSGFSAS